MRGAAAAAVVVADAGAGVAATTVAASASTSVWDICCPARLGIAGRFHLISSDGRMSVVGGAGGKQVSASFAFSFIF